MSSLKDDGNGNDAIFKCNLVIALLSVFCLNDLKWMLEVINDDDESTLV